MWCSKILVAYDGSYASKKALDLAFQIAEQDPSITLVLTHVLRIVSSPAAGIGASAIVIEDAEPVRLELEAYAARAKNLSTVKLLKGTFAADLIVECAKEQGCDLIVMGSRGRGGVKGYLGSVSYAVTKNSPITVLIAKDDE